MIEINNKNEYIDIFNDIDELSKYVSTRPTKKGRGEEAINNEGDSWYGTKTFEEAIDKLTYGDDELYGSLKTELDKLNITKILGNVSNKIKYENRMYGCTPNVPAFLQGNPLNMINPERTVLSHKVVNIFINIRVGSYTKPETITKIGSKYLAVINVLEKAGYRCNVYSGVANSGCITDSLLMVRVKTDKEPFNLKKICFTIASPAMQRRIKFRWMEVNDCREDYTGSYGSTCYDGRLKDLLKYTKQDFIIWNYERNNEEFTVEKILEELKEQGIKIDR